jgi:hypothetical protein
VTDTNRSRDLARKLALRVPPVRRLVDERNELRQGRWRAEKKLASAHRQIAELKQHIAELSSSVPSPGGSPDAAARPLSYLFVVTYGRSGSTLVQGLLDSIPGYLIRGENRGVLYRLYQYHQALEAARDEFGRKQSLTPRDSWYGIDEYSAGAAITRMRALMLDTLLKPQPDTRVVGFKEIRWFYDDWRRYLDFVREVFPGARFVINTRDHEGVANSKWWGNQPKEDVLSRLAGYEEQLDAMAAVLGDVAFRVHYDDYVADPGSLAGLYEWLGEPFDVAAVTATMAVKHSF